MSDALTSQELKVWGDLVDTVRFVMVNPTLAAVDRLSRLRAKAYKTPVPPPRDGERMRLFFNWLDHQLQWIAADETMRAVLAPTLAALTDLVAPIIQPPRDDMLDAVRFGQAATKPYYLRDDDD